MQHRNLTLKLDAELYKEIKILAAKRDTSISALVSASLAELVKEDRDYLQAKERAVALLRQGFDLGTRGQITWSRDELHER
ncbi:MAG: hypothetical protein WDA15_11440 [Trueperaceae bacterium]|jgi:predicted transcriptional regulator